MSDNVCYIVVDESTRVKMLAWLSTGALSEAPTIEAYLKQALTEAGAHSIEDEVIV